MKRFISCLLALIMTLSCAVIVSANDDDVVFEITKQPSAEDPSVEVSLEDEVASYQWQKLGSELTEQAITAENAANVDIEKLLNGVFEEIPEELPIEINYLTYFSSYDSDNEEWLPAVVTTSSSAALDETITNYCAFYFSAYFGEGPVLITLSDNIEESMVAFFEPSGDLSYTLPYDEELGAYFCVIDEPGFYTLEIMSPTDITDLAVSAVGTIANFENITGENESILSEMLPDVTYRCAIKAKDGSYVYSDLIVAMREIISQPTAEDPTFEVTFEEDAEFQWYTATETFVTIDDTMVESADGSFDPQTGLWSGLNGEPYEYAGYEEYSSDYFEIYLKKGQTVKVSLTNPAAISPEDPDMRFSASKSADEYLVFDEYGFGYITAHADDFYYVYQYCKYPETTEVKFEISSYEYEVIEGENEKTLKNGKLGELYAASATYSDDFVLISDAFTAEYAIIKQPTSDDPSVKVNFESDVQSYQWFNVIVSDVVVTDEIANSAYYEGDSIGEPSYYDKENGYWVGSLYTTQEDENGTIYEYDIFEIELAEGETLVLTPDGDIIDNTIFTSGDTTMTEDEFLKLTNSWVFEDGSYYFTAPFDDIFYLYTRTYKQDITFKATLSNVNVLDEAIEGENEAALTDPVNGTCCLCVITYKDGTVLISDYITVEITYTLGDVNDDGAIDQFDYILIKRHYFETRLLTDDELMRADVNQDGVIDQFDYILVKRIYFGTYTIG